MRLLRPDVAVVQVAGTNQTPRGGETQTSEALISLVMTKESGGWKIAGFQNTGVTAKR